MHDATTSSFILSFANAFLFLGVGLGGSSPFFFFLPYPALLKARADTSVGSSAVCWHFKQRLTTTKAKMTITVPDNAPASTPAFTELGGNPGAAVVVLPPSCLVPVVTEVVVVTVVVVTVVVQLASSQPVPPVWLLAGSSAAASTNSTQLP